MSDQTILEVEDLRTEFQTQQGTVRAVDGVSLTLRAGETLGIVGESGSGKSVLGRSIMGLISSNHTTTVHGTARIAGEDIHSMSARKRRSMWGPQVAMVFQDPMTSLNPVKRVGTHITEALRLHLGLDKRAAAQRAIDLLRQVGIPEPSRRMKQFPHELSGGMRQRVVIAMALCCDPQLLIADEPTTALDVTVQKQILDLLTSLAESRQMATILISHDLGAVAGRTDQVQVMYAGRVVERSRTAAVFDGPRHPYTEGLLASIPQLSDPPHTVLQAIVGSPPNMANPPDGCRFAPRCPHAQQLCLDEDPVLLEIGSQDQSHVAACHYALPASDLEANPPRTALAEEAS